METNANDNATPKTPEIGWRTPAMWAGLAAALVGLVLAAVLVGAHVAYKQADPLNSVELARLKLHVGQNPKDKAAKQRIRELDVDLRNEYFRHVTFARRGNWLLLGCVVVFLLGVLMVLC